MQHFASIYGNYFLFVPVLRNNIIQCRMDSLSFSAVSYLTYLAIDQHPKEPFQWNKKTSLRFLNMQSGTVHISPGTSVASSSSILFKYIISTPFLHRVSSHFSHPSEWAFVSRCSARRNGCTWPLSRQRYTRCKQYRSVKFTIDLSQ